MTLDKDKLIEAMAKAMLKYNNFDEDCVPLGTFKEEWEISKHHWLAMAGAVLKALQDYMPAIDKTTCDDLALYYHESQLWNELKNLGK